MKFKDKRVWIGLGALALAVAVLFLYQKLVAPPPIVMTPVSQTPAAPIAPAVAASTSVALSPNAVPPALSSGTLSEKTGRLGGGYREARWGMSPAEVKQALAENLEFETRLPQVEKILKYDLGEGRKLVCRFDHEQFYRAEYHPIAADGEEVVSEAVLSGLQKKYGPGQQVEGFTDREGRPLRIFKWNDGVSEIELRMPPETPKGQEKTDDKSKIYASSTIMITYTGLEINAKREKLLQMDTKRQEEEKLKRKIQNIESNL